MAIFLHRQEDADSSEATQCNTVVSILNYHRVQPCVILQQRKAEDLNKRTWHINMDKKSPFRKKLFKSSL